MLVDGIKLGDRLREARKEAGLTQQDLADKLDVSYQAVSLWENGSVPTLDKLIRCSEILGVSLSSLVEERNESLNDTSTAIFDHKHMSTFIKGKASALKMRDTLKALSYASDAHEKQDRKTNFKLKENEKPVPYIYHPLSMACCLLSLGIEDDVIIAATIMHDVLEDCVMVTDGEYKNKVVARSFADKNKMEYRDLVKGDFTFATKEVMDIVELLSHKKENGEERDTVMGAYYKAIASNPKACLIKCTDRLNNLGSMSWGISRERMYRQIVETEKYYPKLLNVIKKEQDYNNIAWQYTYQIKTLLDIYKRLL